MNQTWNSIFKELKPLGYVRIPSCYFYPGFSKIDVHVQLHTFSNASERAYAAVVYIQVVYSDGRIETRLVASKTIVLPIKKQTIPCLKLLGAVILSQLATTILKALAKQVNQIIYWVDSKTVLCWIQNDKHRKQYFKHCVDKIRQLTAKRDWRHCPGESSNEEEDHGLNSTGISWAESLWIRTVQASSFKDELKFVQKQCQPKPRCVEQFGLFLDKKKLLRCQGQLNNATLSSDNKNPILLPSKHPYVESIILQTHDKV